MNAATLPLKTGPDRDVADARADRGFRWLVTGAGVLVLVSLGAAALSMLWGGRAAFEKFGVAFLWRDAWDPVQQDFGALVPIYGTLVTALIAMIIAVPVSFGIAMYLTEIAPKWLRGPVGSAIELLAGIPSIIYGMWGLFVLVPFLAEYVYPWVDENMGAIPFIGMLFSGPPLGLGMGTAGLVLAVVPDLWTDRFTKDPAVLAAADTYFHWAGPLYALYGAGLSLYSSAIAANRVGGQVLAGTLRLLLVAVAPADGMAIYRAAQREIEQLTGQINGHFGTMDWMPVVLSTTPMPFDEVVAANVAADIAWITPLRDGLNLVAKEYAAAKDGDAGVLVLSEFAGSAVELPDAVSTNPYSMTQMDEAIDAALDMPVDERRERMARMASYVGTYDMAHWTATVRESFAQMAGWDEELPAKSPQPA